MVNMARCNPIKWDLLDPTDRCIDNRMFHRGFMPLVDFRATVEFRDMDCLSLDGTYAHTYAWKLLSKSDGYGTVYLSTDDTFADVARNLGLPEWGFEAVLIEDAMLDIESDVDLSDILDYVNGVEKTPTPRIIETVISNFYVDIKDGRLRPYLLGKQAFYDVARIVGNTYQPDDKIPGKGNIMFLFDVWDDEENIRAGYLLETCRVW